jgi:hypothetical protein
VKTTTKTSRSTRATHRLEALAEGLEPRCLLSVTSSLATYMPPSPPSAAAPSPAMHVSLSPDGSLWWTTRNFIERVAPDGTPTQFALPSPPDDTSWTITSNIVFTPDDSAWLAVSNAQSSWIEQLTPAGAFTTATRPQSTPIDNLSAAGNKVWFTQDSQQIEFVSTTGTTASIPPTSLTVTGLAASADNTAWFAGQTTNDQTLIGSVAAGDVVQTALLAVSPTSIAATPNGDLYAAAPGTLLHITADGSISSLDFPGITSTPVAASPNGTIWFVQSFDGSTSIDTLSTNGTLKAFSLPTADAQVQALTVGSDGTVWFAGTSSEGIFRGQVSSTTGQSTSSLVNTAISAGNSTSAFDLASTGGTTDASPLDIPLGPVFSATPALAPTTPHPAPLAPASPTADSAPADEPAASPPPTATAAAPVSTKPASDPAVFEGEFAVVAHGAVPVKEELTPRSEEEDSASITPTKHQQPQHLALAPQKTASPAVVPNDDAQIPTPSPHDPTLIAADFENSESPTPASLMRQTLLTEHAPAHPLPRWALLAMTIFAAHPDPASPKLRERKRRTPR